MRRPPRRPLFLTLRALLLLCALPCALVACARERFVHVYGAPQGGRLHAYDFDTPAAPPPELTALMTLAAQHFERSPDETPPYIRSSELTSFGAVEIASLKERAARELACDASSIRVLRYADMCAALVDGCNRRNVYLWLEVERLTRAAPGLEGRLALLHVGEFFPVQEPPARAKRELVRLLPPRDDGSGWDALAEDSFSICGTDESHPYNGFGRLIELNAQAARDLACPANQVFPGWDVGARGATRRPIRAFGEGCGRRAWYGVNSNSSFANAVLSRIEPCAEPGCAPTSSEAPKEP